MDKALEILRSSVNDSIEEIRQGLMNKEIIEIDDKTKSEL
jgi:hypothetical protein